MTRQVIKILIKKDTNHITRIVIEILAKKGYKSHNEANDKKTLPEGKQIT